MNCAFCGEKTDSRIVHKNIVIITHESCLKYRKEELSTKSALKCLLYEDRVKIHAGG